MPRTPDGRVVIAFRGDRFRFLSNFYRVDIDGYPSVEHFFQAMKSKDTEYRERVKNATTCARAKSMGGAVKLREDWEKIKVDVMLHALRIKFNPDTNPDFADALLETKDFILIEGNQWHDSYWGACTCGNCPPGTNKLGELLMQVRKELEEK